MILEARVLLSWMCGIGLGMAIAGLIAFGWGVLSCLAIFAIMYGGER